LFLLLILNKFEEISVFAIHNFEQIQTMLISVLAVDTTSISKMLITS
jgi:hypothetical protein